MKFIRSVYKLHGGVDFSVLEPCLKEHTLIAGVDPLGYIATFSNGTGYAFFESCLLAACNLNVNEVIKIPISDNASLYSKDWEVFNYYNNIYLVNYCSTQLSSKVISKSRDIKTVQKEIITKRISHSDREWVAVWDFKNRLTIKSYSNNIFIYTNSDGFLHLSNGAKQFIKWGDSKENNMCCGHYHYDMEENTYKSLGITMHYWHTDETFFRSKKYD